MLDFHDGAYEVNGVGEAAINSLPSFLPSRRISAEGKDVLDAASFCFLERTINLGNLHVGTREMHLRLQTQVALEVGC